MVFLRHFSNSIIRKEKSPLTNFLKQTDKDVTSTVYRGTMFELQTLESLQTTTGMRLEHVGGKSDGGIDLRGQWFNNINIIIQCKNLKTGCTPDHIRQLMGTTVIFTTKKQKTIGILSTISHRHFTRDVLSHFNSSPVPLGLATVQDTTLKSLMFNKKAQDILKGLIITTQFDTQGKEQLFISIP
jgi:hypothetical protein